MTDWPRYLATMLREEGQWAEANHEPSRALDAFRRYLSLRHDPEAKPRLAGGIGPPSEGSLAGGSGALIDPVLGSDSRSAVDSTDRKPISSESFSHSSG